MNVQRLRIGPWLAFAFASPLVSCALIVGDVDGHRLFVPDAGVVAEGGPPLDATNADDPSEEEPDLADGADAAPGDEGTLPDRDAAPDVVGPDGAGPYVGPPIVLAVHESGPTGIVATSGALYWVDSQSLTIRALARAPDGGFAAQLADGGPAAATAASIGSKTSAAADLVTDGKALYILSSGGNCFLYMSGNLPISDVPTCYYPVGLCRISRMATDYASSSIVLDALMQPNMVTGSDCAAGSYPTILFQTTPSLNTSQNTGWHDVGPIDAGAPQAIAANAQSIFYAVSSTASVTNGAVLYELPRTPPFVAKSLGQSIGSTVTDIAVDATSVYWADSAGYLYAAPINGGAPYRSLAGASLSPPPSRLVLDDANVYWVSTGSPSALGSVGFVSKQGGPAVKLAGGLNQPYALAIDGHGLYWTNTGDGTVMMLRPGR